MRRAKPVEAEAALEAHMLLRLRLVRAINARATTEVGQWTTRTESEIESNQLVDCSALSKSEIQIVTTI